MENQNVGITPSSFIKLNKIIYFAIFASLLFVSVFFFLILENQEFKIDFENKNFIISICIGVLAIIGSGFIFKQLQKKITQNLDLKQKLGQLQTAYIIQYAILEIAILIIIFIFANDKSFFIICGFVVVYMLSLMPSLEKIQNHLNLNSEQRLQFQKRDEVIN